MRMMSPHARARSVTALYRQGHVAHAKGDLDVALQCYVRALELDPGHAGALHDAALLGKTLNDHARAAGRPSLDAEAETLMALAVAAEPTNAAAVHNFAKFKHDLGRVDEAKQLYEHAVSLDPTQGESWVNLGNVYGEIGNRMRSEACWIRAMECPAESPEARFNLSFVKLLKGDYAAGWAAYESRWQCPTFCHTHGRDDLTAPRWTGERIDGTLYLHQEQGAGDAVMMARYLPLVRPRVGTVIVEVIAALVPLFESMFPDLPIVSRGETPPAHDVACPMLSLPAIFGTTVETIPEPVAFWPNGVDGLPIQAEPGRIGLCWRGSTTHTNDRIRSMPFEATFALLDIPGLTWQSLQFGYQTSPPLDSLPVGDFLETARQIARCAVVVTVDTSIAHLSASMGVPTWVVLPFAAEWRWGEASVDTPWYRSALLWRQPRAGDWRAVMDAIAGALASTEVSNA